MAGTPAERIQALEMNLSFHKLRIDELESGNDKIANQLNSLEKRLQITFSILLGATLVTSKYGAELLSFFFK